MTIFFALCASAIAGAGCRGGGAITDETLAAAYAELSVQAGGDSVRAARVLDSLGLTPEGFVAAVSEKAENLKEWQTIHESALRKIDVAAVREDRRKVATPSISPRQ